MLFYTQVKRQFTPSIWTSGRTHFWEERVLNVQITGEQISAQVQLTDGKMHEVTISTSRGMISQSRCTCGLQEKQRMHCSHIAALCIWIVERGSLLRAGLYEEPTKPRTFVPAEPIAFVRPLFDQKVFTALSVEPAIRYQNPETKTIEVVSLNRLAIQPGSHNQILEKIYKTSEGLFLKTTIDSIPILGSIEASRLTYMGQAGLEKLATLLTAIPHSQVVFHENLRLQVDPDPLTLASFNIGKRTDRGRILSYCFQNKNLKLHSDELFKLAQFGRVSCGTVWVDQKLYRLQPQLSLLARYANRSGIVASEEESFTKIVEGYSYLDDDKQRPLHPLTAFRLSLELGVKDFTVDSDWKEFHEWLKDFNKKKLPGLPSVDYGFLLRDYQGNGLSWIWSLYHRGLSSLLADEMGLGKTHQALALLTSLYCNKKRPSNPSMVIAPPSVISAWIQKLKKYDTQLKWYVYHGKDRKIPHDAALVLTTYGLLQKETILRERAWEVVILDEAQAIKNAQTISSRASRILKGRFKIAMTGTPIENQAADLWSVMEFLLPGYLGSLPRFRRLYGTGRELPSAEQAETLKRLVQPFLLRRTKDQVLKELPEKIEEMVFCDFTPFQKGVYGDYIRSQEAEKIREEIKEGKKINYSSILALLTKLKQVCDHPRLPELTSGQIKNLTKINPLESGKWEAFEEIVQEALRSELKIVVFTQYLGMLDLFGHWLQTQGVHFVELRGDTIDRGKPLNEFATNPDCKVFLCSLLAGGLGIDLTSASVCIHYDRWWNPARENQATDRLHRIGQTRGVQVFKFQSPGTVEDRIAGIIESKVELSKTLIEASPLSLKAFSRQELLELLTNIPG